MTLTVVPAAGPGLLKPKDAAKSLAISERSLWSLTASGEVQAVRIGRAVRYSPEALAEFVAKQSTGKRRK